MEKNQIKVGDIVRLKTIDLLEGVEQINWIEDEIQAPQVGDTFKVTFVDENGWGYLQGLRYGHPLSKFELT